METGGVLVICDVPSPSDASENMLLVSPLNLIAKNA